VDLRLDARVRVALDSQVQVPVRLYARVRVTVDWSPRISGGMPLGDHVSANVWEAPGCTCNDNCDRDVKYVPDRGESKRFATEDFKSRKKAYRDADYDA